MFDPESESNLEIKSVLDQFKKIPMDRFKV